MRGRARKLADEGHGFFADRTKWCCNGRGGDQGRRGPIQESQDALPFGFGGSTEEAEIADALETARQDMLEKAMEEGLGG